MITPHRASCLFASLVLLCDPGAARAQRADLVLIGGTVVTVDPARSEGEAVAIRGHEILAVGTDAEIRALVGEDTEVIDVGGRLVIPGFIEGHGHFMGLGQAQMNLDLTTATSWQDIVDMVAAAAREAEPGDWILGRGWHQEKWQRTPERLIDGVPTHETLSAVSPDNPVLLTHASGHAAFANARALELAGITRDTPDPDGGTIVRDGSGEATGLLRETADELVGRALARDRASQDDAQRARRTRQAVQLAGWEAITNGVTSFHDAGSGFGTIDLFRRLADRGELPVRLYVMVRDDVGELAEKLDEYRMIGYADAFLTVRAIKLSIDGALGSHGAWLLEPYTDMPETSGLNTTPLSVAERVADLAIEHGYQLNIHAIGDRANREVLDLYEATFRESPSPTPQRWRIEHAQHLHPADIARFGELGVIASMQAVHATSDGPWVPRRLGPERAESGAYVWRDLIDSGALVTNGTDVPVERIDPIANFHAAVTRRLADGSTFYADQRMTRMEALRAYTINNAYAAFQESSLGSITPGKLADLVVLSANILTIPADQIPDAEVVMTILGGEIVYRSPDALTPDP
ncbi:MAG: amidohydrolase [Longimicrobiales bacterium]